MSDLLILCYHAVSGSWQTEFAVSPRRLESQVGSLLRRGYRPSTLSAAIAGRPSAKTLVVSFDDAYRSVLEEGYPVLAGLGVPATVYVPTGFATSQQPMAWAEMAKWAAGSFRSELECMSWDELRRLADEGWEIGSHSRSHPDLTSLSDAELDSELRGSREDCERELQRPCPALAYPFSSWNQRVKDSAKAAGYDTAVILDSRISIHRPSLPSAPDVSRDRFELLRSGVYRGDGRLRFAAKTSRAVRQARASRAANLLGL